MLKKYLRSSIIVMIQILLPVLLLLILAPHLIQSHDNFNHAQHFFMNNKNGFLIFHILFYLVLIWIWPKLIYAWINRSPDGINTTQIKSALNAKWYLLAAFLFFELLNWWR